MCVTGIYYVPGSLKAKLCVEGLDLSYAYFKDRNIPHEICGKVCQFVNQIKHRSSMPTRMLIMKTYLRARIQYIHSNDSVIFPQNLITCS